MIVDDFVLRALAAGVLIAVVCGPLGCFIVWRRMAYFGDTMSHSALLGVALGLALEMNVTLGVVAVCVAIALLLFSLQNQQRLATDTLLGIFAHASLSLGLVALSFMEGIRVDLMSYLFGDILAVTSADLWLIGIGGAIVLAVLMGMWRLLLAMTVNADLAAAEGVPVVWVRLGFMLLIALVIAIAMKIIGILLITSLLIIPAAAARRFAHTPEQMALTAAVLGVIAVAMGLGASLQWDSPSGPSIVVAATLLFLVSLLAGGLKDARARNISR
ncbi:MAG: zinc ABC transporter permease subunit ZnuB [Gammaproteobacteria bacterium]